MAAQYSYGYLKEAVKAHLDLEENEFETMNVSSRFHIFANEAMQQICASKPKYVYFQFQTVTSFAPLIYDDGQLRMATTIEQFNLAPSSLASQAETIEWYNKQGIYLVGQVITMPADFLAFAVKKAFTWNAYLPDKIQATKQHITYLSNDELVVHYAANYLIPYQATWVSFASTTEDDALLPMPSDLALTIPVYVASVCLQQRNLSMAQSKRQEFEIALQRCKSINFLETISSTPSFR